MSALHHGLRFAIALLLLVLDGAFPAAAETIAPVKEPRLFTPEEEWTFIFALTYAETVEPDLDYHLQHFHIVARDPASHVRTVNVCGAPKKGSAWWSCGAVTFHVLVAPDGRIF